MTAAHPGRGAGARQDEGVEIVDLRFCDLPGLMQHFSVPAHALTESTFDGRLRLRRLLDPRLPGDPGVGHDPAAGPDRRRYVDPFRQHKTLNMQLLRARPGHAARPTPATRATWPRRPRTYLKSTGIADTAYFGPEAEFFIFDDVRFEDGTEQRPSTRSTPSRASGTPAATRRPQPRLQAPHKEGYFPVPPMDHFQDLRSEMVLVMDARHRDRGAAPRGGHRRPGRDRHALRHAAGHGATS